MAASQKLPAIRYPSNYHTSSENSTKTRADDEAEFRRRASHRARPAHTFWIPSQTNRFGTFAKHLKSGLLRSLNN